MMQGVVQHSGLERESFLHLPHPTYPAHKDYQTFCIVGHLGLILNGAWHTNTISCSLYDTLLGLNGPHT